MCGSFSIAHDSTFCPPKINSNLFNKYSNNIKYKSNISYIEINPKINLNNDKVIILKYQ